MKQLLILIFLLSASWSYAQKDPRTLTKEQWKEDILFLKEQIEKNHIDPFHFQNKQEWDKAFDDLEVALPDLTYQQIVSRIISLAASVGDGHTNARPYTALTRYPVTFQWFGEDLRIIRIAKGDSQVLGAKVLKVDGMKVSDAHNRLKSLIPAHESPTFVLGWSEYLFSLDEILIGTGIKKTGPLKLQVQLADGKKKTVSLSLPEKNQPVEKIWAYNPLPLYLSAPERSPYYEWIPKADKVLYFNFERYPEWDQMRSFGMGLIGFIQDNEVKKLIVDLRENGGGDFKKGLKLIEELQKTYLNAPGKVYVIIGRNTFSAGMSNAAHFKTMLQATLVGETTGARPVGYQENFSFTLPHSNIAASCAVKRYAFLDEDTDGIIPDKEILPDFNLYEEGRDAAIEWIVRDIQYPLENSLDYEKIYTLCMDANVKEALTLLEVDEHKMSAQDKKFRQQFEQRFQGEKDMTVYSVSKDSLIHQLISMFSDYWRVSLLDPMNNYDRQLGGNLIGFLKRNYPPVREKSVQLDSLGIYLSRFIHSRGSYTHEEVKKTGRLYDLVIWSEQQDTAFSVNQFGEQKLVVVSMLDGFETLGWMEYATLGKHYSSGWATHEKLYCVRKAYDLGGEEFKVSFLAHEAQHLTDADRYPLLKNVDLEYRAKLAELGQANETLYDLLEFFIRNAKEESGNGHSVANHRVIRDLSASIFNTDFEDNMSVWRGKDKFLINKRARRLLQANSKLLERP